jgi:hypothetical protein
MAESARNALDSSPADFEEHSMPHSSNRLVPVLLAAVLLVGAANLGAYAATGGPLLIGKSNTGSKTTTLKTTGNKAALSLKSEAGKAPLKVSNSTKVTKLNADLVDGLHAGALQTKSYVYNLTAIGITTNYATFSLPGLPRGRYLVSFNVAADVTGAATFVGCFLLSGPAASATVALVALGVGNGGGEYFVSGSGYVDTTNAAYRFACQRSGGTTMTIPASSQFPARLVLTRVDDVSTVASTGANSTLPRGLAP